MVRVREKYDRQLADIGWDERPLREYLERWSGLPGPRANLELAAAFAERAARLRSVESDALVECWAGLTADAAPTGTAAEFLPFAAVQAVGALAADHAVRDRCLRLLADAAHDVRWRLREAAAFALQQLGERDIEAVRDLVAAWEGDDPQLLRALLVGFAHPPILGDAATRGLGWRLAERALVRVRQGHTGATAVDPADIDPDDDIGLEADSGPKAGLAAEVGSRGRGVMRPHEEGEERRILSAALGFVPSVLVAADPDDGFRRLRRWAALPEREAKKLVLANLRKARLAKSFPERCAEIAEELWTDQ
jgi:hypothetical protein